MSRQDILDKKQSEFYNKSTKIKVKMKRLHFLMFLCIFF